jgi:DNA-directed RNA polymerase subunit D
MANKIKVKPIEQKGNIIRFNVSGVSRGLANALRRIIISEVPIMAIEDITFYNNSSIMNDEVLAHSMGLIPIKTDLKTYNFIWECKCKGKGCARCTCLFSLDAEGPCMIYTRDIKSKDPKTVPVYDNMPVVKLTKNQKVKMEARAQLGTGKDHIKWQGGLAAYEIKPDGSYDFLVESYGQLDVKELVSVAFDILEDKIGEVKKNVK